MCVRARWGGVQRFVCLCEKVFSRMFSDVLNASRLCIAACMWRVCVCGGTEGALVFCLNIHVLYVCI